MPHPQVIALAVVLLLIPGGAFAQADFSAVAVRAEHIHVDGRLEEPEWSSATGITDFVQSQPSHPNKSTLPVSVRFLYDDEALYAGYICYDTAPDSVRGQIQRRDNDSNSDFVDLYLDTFHDRRNGYWFTVTAGGVQAEGTFFAENSLSASWDAVWESAVAVTDSGWICEIRVPFQIIRHGGVREDGWGLGMARKLYRRNESDFWPPVDPRTGWIASGMGTLHGLQNIAPSAHLEILPHAVGRWDAPSTMDWHSENEIENLGLYVKAVPSAAWTVDLAYQPDFAQVDVDDETINLSDYPVFLSEKRPFFIESNQIFEETPYRFFYSRRVADPDYGGRLNFQQGRVRASLLASKNRTSDDRLQDDFAGRMTVNVGEKHRIGVVSTYLNQTGYSAKAVGIDGRFRWREQDRLQVWFGAVERSGDGESFSVSGNPVHDEQPVEARLAYNRDYGPFRSDLALAYRGIDFDNNDLGWSDFSNVLRQAWWIGDNYFHESGLFRNNGFDINLYHTTFTDGTHSDGYGNINSFNTLRNNWEFGSGFEWGDNFRRRYSDEGEFRDNFGSYDTEYYKYWWHWFWVYSDNTKPVRYGIDSRYRTFRDGRSFGLDPFVTWRPRSNIEINPRLNWTQVWRARDFNDETADFRIWIIKATWSPSLKLSFRGTLQWYEAWWEYDDTPRPYSDRNRLYTNLLLSYNWHPGSWFYLVYDETFRDVETMDNSIPGDRTLRAKLTYFFTAP